MKIKSLLSNEWIKSVLLLISIIAILAVLQIFISATSTLDRSAYHISKWNEFAPEIERALNANRVGQPVDLVHIYGGVVPHHIPTTIPRLVEFYTGLARTQTVKNFIIIGPDHTEAGSSPVTVSNARFVTTYGEVEPTIGLAKLLDDLQLANIEEWPFEDEHSVGAQILIISKIFPDARVMPIIFRSDVSRNQTQALADRIASFMDEETVLIASVDFSHYLSTAQAMPLDQISGEVVRNLDIDSIPLLKADSAESMEVFMQVMRNKDAFDTADFEVLNTNDFMQNSDFTTGYVFGYWGAK